MIKKIIIAVISILFIGGFTYLYLIGKPVNIEKNLTTMQDVEDDLKEAIYYATLAPSSHNAQNWKLEIDTHNAVINVMFDESRKLEAVDPFAREAYISLGAFIETLQRALNAYGYRTQISYNNDQNTPLAATIDYTKNNQTLMDVEALSIIEKRHTNKRKYKNNAIAQDVIEQLIMEDVSYFAKNTEEFQYIARATINAYEKQAANQSKRDELVEWLRFSDAETIRKKDGLPAEQLGLTGFVKIFYYLFFNDEVARSDEFAEQSIKKTIKQLEHSAGFFVITGGNDKEELIKTGMKLQSFWLNAVKHNIALQPMSQIMEEEPYASEARKRLKVSDNIHMILRAGIVDNYGKNRKIRRDISDIIVIKEEINEE